MFPEYTPKKMAVLLIGLAFGVPWIWNKAYWKPWSEENLGFMGGYQVTNLIIMLLVVAACVSFILMKTDPSAWSDTSFKSIENVKEYRNARLAGMSPEEGAKLLAQTQLLDMAGSNETDSATGRAMRHMNSRLAGMSPAQGLEWLRKGGK
jgi:hypothetical protein